MTDLTWAETKGRKVHIACLEAEEIVPELRLHSDNHPFAGDTCERCGIELSDVPDP